jgi:serine/threonine-protein kinase RsbW
VTAPWLAPRTLRLPAADLADLSGIRAFVGQGARDLGADELCEADLIQAVDEWATNVLVHGYRRRAGPLDVDIEPRGASVIVRVDDEAPPFDPTTWPAPDLERPLLERAPGGMGIFLTRACVDVVEHTTLGPTGNRLTLVRRLHTGAEEGPT